MVHENQIFGLTKGQASPTTDVGHKTKMQVQGVISEPLKPLAVAITLGCTFVARSYSADKKHLISIIMAAINHEGYALVDILQPCVTFNHINTYQWYKERSYYLDESYDPTNKEEAYKKALEWGDGGIPLGIIYKEDKPIFRKKISYLGEGPALVDRQWNSINAEAFMEDFR